MDIGTLVKQKFDHEAREIERLIRHECPSYCWYRQEDGNYENDGILLSDKAHNRGLFALPLTLLTASSPEAKKVSTPPMERSMEQVHVENSANMMELSPIGVENSRTITIQESVRGSPLATGGLREDDDNIVLSATYPSEPAQLYVKTDASDAELNVAVKEVIDSIMIDSPMRLSKEYVRTELTNWLSSIEVANSQELDVKDAFTQDEYTEARPVKAASKEAETTSSVSPTNTNGFAAETTNTVFAHLRDEESYIEENFNENITLTTVESLSPFAHQGTTRNNTKKDQLLGVQQQQEIEEPQESRSNEGRTRSRVESAFNSKAEGGQYQLGQEEAELSLSSDLAEGDVDSSYEVEDGPRSPTPLVSDAGRWRNYQEDMKRQQQQRQSQEGEALLQQREAQLEEIYRLEQERARLEKERMRLVQEEEAVRQRTQKERKQKQELVLLQTVHSSEEDNNTKVPAEEDAPPIELFKMPRFDAIYKARKMRERAFDYLSSSDDQSRSSTSSNRINLSILSSVDDESKLLARARLRERVTGVKPAPVGTVLAESLDSFAAVEVQREDQRTNLGRESDTVLTRQSLEGEDEVNIGDEEELIGEMFVDVIPKETTGSTQGTDFDTDTRKKIAEIDDILEEVGKMKEAADGQVYRTLGKDELVRLEEEEKWLESAMNERLDFLRRKADGL